MSINPSSVTPKAIRLKSPSGVFFEVDSVAYFAANGEALFKFEKPYQALSDGGLWEIYSAIDNRISDLASNFVVANQRIGEFYVGAEDSAEAQIAAIKAQQDAQSQSLQKATQSIADLALLVAKGTGGASSTELKALEDKLTALDTSKADKTALDALDASVKLLNTAIAQGATDKELADAIALVDKAIAAIQSAIKPLVGRTVYTLATTIDALVGDEIHIDLEGDIQLPAAPPDGSEVRVFDEFGKIKAGKNNVLLGTGDRWSIYDGSFDTTALTFTDNELRHGWIRLKYTAATKSWWPYVLHGVQQTSGSTPNVVGVGGDRIASAVLSLLSPNQWTNWPSLTGSDAGLPISLDRIESGEKDLTNLLEVDRAGKQVRSLQEHRNLKFVYEVHGATANDGGDRLVTAILSDLTANQWVNWPQLTGTDAGKSFSLDLIKSSTGEDLTSRIEVNRSAQQVRSLTRYQNVQFVYEVH
jgi:hypothetical protein